MRVIAGAWKGRNLVAPQGNAVRPTTDRVKESMFNLMGLAWHGDIVVDLFAGSGALGIEALSRGAKHAIFVDCSPVSLRALSDNLRHCDAGSLASVLHLDWQRGWQRAQVRAQELEMAVGWVFVDPPYQLNLWEPVLERIAASEMPIVDGIVCEHPRTQQLPSAVRCLHQTKQRSYGDISLTFYEMVSPEA